MDSVSSCAYFSVNGLSMFMCSFFCQWIQYAHVFIFLSMTSVCSCVHIYVNGLSMLIVLSMASVCSCALVNTEVSLLYMWIWSSLCSWMPWPHEVPCHPRWQCWSPSWIYFCGGISRFMCSNKHWNISSIHVNMILTVLVDALAPWGAMSFTVTMLISKLDLFLSRHQ